MRGCRVNDRTTRTTRCGSGALSGACGSAPAAGTELCRCIPGRHTPYPLQVAATRPERWTGDHARRAGLRGLRLGTHRDTAQAGVSADRLAGAGRPGHRAGTRRHRPAVGQARLGPAAAEEHARRAVGGRGGARPGRGARSRSTARWARRCRRRRRLRRGGVAGAGRVAAAAPSRARPAVRRGSRRRSPSAPGSGCRPRRRPPRGRRGWRRCAACCGGAARPEELLPVALADPARTNLAGAAPVPAPAPALSSSAPAQPSPAPALPRLPRPSRRLPPAPSAPAPVSVPSATTRATSVAAGCVGRRAGAGRPAGLRRPGRAVGGSGRRWWVAGAALVAIAGIGAAVMLPALRRRPRGRGARPGAGRGRDRRRPAAVDRPRTAGRRPANCCARRCGPGATAYPSGSGRPSPRCSTPAPRTAPASCCCRAPTAPARAGWPR